MRELPVFHYYYLCDKSPRGLTHRTSLQTWKVYTVRSQVHARAESCSAAQQFPQHPMSRPRFAAPRRCPRLCFLRFSTEITKALPRSEQPTPLSFPPSRSSQASRSKTARVLHRLFPLKPLQLQTTSRLIGGVGARAPGGGSGGPQPLIAPAAAGTRSLTLPGTHPLISLQNTELVKKKH